MRQRLDELRQVRKEAAVITIAVCCGVPGLFCAQMEFYSEQNSLLSKFRLRVFNIVTKKII